MRAKFRTRADAKTVPIIPIEKDVFDAWRADQPEAMRAWVKSTEFTATPRSLSLVPEENGTLGSVLLGVEAHDDFWAYADLPGRLPAGTYRIDARMDRPSATGAALGWAMGCYAFDRYVAKSAAPVPALVWPEGADRAHVRAAAEATTSVRDLINTAGRRHGSGGACPPPPRRIADAGGARMTEIKGTALLRRGYPTIHAVGRASANAPRLIDLRWGRTGRAQGDLDRQGRVLRFRRSRHQAGPGHASHEEGHGRRRPCAGARPDDHVGEARRQAARADTGGREQHIGQRPSTARTSSRREAESPSRSAIPTPRAG